MDAEAKKTVLRMIPYGIYVMTAAAPDGRAAAATVNWVTQTAFQPPLIVVGVKADSFIAALVKETRGFALNMLGKGQQGLAFGFFKPARLEGDRIGGQPCRMGPAVGAPILIEAPAAVEAKVVQVIEHGDHHVVLAEVVEAHLMQPPAGRPDAAILEMKELGEKVFYGG
jgi:flavin reductase (DIM6/NTAB) family NADH-FMN oxidoreductase RutF